MADPPPPLDAGLPTDTAAARAMLAKLGPRFGAQYAPHFTILSDADSDRTASLGQLAEEIWQRVNIFAAHLRVTTQAPTKKLMVVYFDTWEGFESFLRPGGFVISPGVPGFFDQVSNRCVMFNSANGPLLRNKRRELTTAPAIEPQARPIADVNKARRDLTAHEQIINETVFRHELAHQVFFNIGVQTPSMRDRRWLQEGLAMQFESTKDISPYRGADFLAIDIKDCEPLFRSVLSDPKFLAPGAKDSARAYAAAWAIVYYLIHEQPKPLAVYLAMPAGALDEELATFERSFGVVDEKFAADCRKLVATAHIAR